MVMFVFRGDCPPCLINRFPNSPTTRISNHWTSLKTSWIAANSRELELNPCVWDKRVCTEERTVMKLACHLIYLHASPIYLGYPYLTNVKFLVQTLLMKIYVDVSARNIVLLGCERGCWNDYLCRRFSVWDHVYW